MNKPQSESLPHRRSLPSSMSRLFFSAAAVSSAAGCNNSPGRVGAPHGGCHSLTARFSHLSAADPFVRGNGHGGASPSWAADEAGDAPSLPAAAWARGPLPSRQPAHTASGWHRRGVGMTTREGRLTSHSTAPEAPREGNSILLSMCKIASPV